MGPLCGLRLGQNASLTLNNNNLMGGLKPLIRDFFGFILFLVVCCIYQVSGTCQPKACLDMGGWTSQEGPVALHGVILCNLIKIPFQFLILLVFRAALFHLHRLVEVAKTKNRIKRGLKIFDKGNLRVSLLMMGKTVFLYDGSFPHK